MLKSNVEIINELKQFIYLTKENDEVLRKFTFSSNDFTRDKKLNLDRLILFISKLNKKTLSIELDDFFEEVDKDLPCTVSAFVQQRQKLKPEFFSAWNDLLLLSNTFHNSGILKKWNNYWLIGVDGSNLPLANTIELQNYFGGQSNQEGSFVQAKTFYYYDILNSLVLYAQICPYRKSELAIAYEGMKFLRPDMLMIYDRNFFNFKMMALHLWQNPELKFVIRAKESNAIVKKFIKSKRLSSVVAFPITSNAIQGLKEHNFIVDKKSTIKVRLVRVQLEKEVEILATNLWEDEGYDNTIFKSLYFKRWKLETHINFEKSILQLEKFSGKTPVAIEQDFYATIFLSNLLSILCYEANEILSKENSKRQYRRKTNQNKCQGKLRKTLVKLFLEKDPEDILKKLTEYFIRDPVPIREGRRFPRKFKAKVKTFSNYKIAC